MSAGTQDLPNRGATMDLRYLERRQDLRTPTYVPISIFVDGRESETPAHLVDLSYSGAAVLTTLQNAPEIGSHLNVHFETPNGDGGAEATRRIESGIVVNASTPDRGVQRIGIRFFHRPDNSVDLIDPIDLLSDHKKLKDSQQASPKRWQTARNFRSASSPVGASSAN